MEMELRKGHIIRIKPCNLPYANETGEITGFIPQGKDKPRLLAVRLDHGYQSTSVGYKDIRYTCIIEETMVSRCADDVPRSYSKRICSFCRKPCYSNLLTKIAYEVKDTVVCAKCQNDVIFEAATGTFKTFAEDLATRKAAKSSAPKRKKE